MQLRLAEHPVAADGELMVMKNMTGKTLVATTQGVWPWFGRVLRESRPECRGEQAASDEREAPDLGAQSLQSPADGAWEALTVKDGKEPALKTEE